MGKEMLPFGEIEIENNKFYRSKNPIFIDIIDIEKVLVSNKVFLVKKNINNLLVTRIMILQLDHYI